MQNNRFSNTLITRMLCQTTWIEKINPFPQNKGIKINTNKATWSIINNELIHITYELPNRNGQGGLDLYYSNSILFFGQGDPDDNKKIELKHKDNSYPAK